MADLKLTKGAAHVTDYSNASLVQCYLTSIHWSGMMRSLKNWMTEMYVTGTETIQLHLTEEADPSYLGGPIPIAGAAGDQQSALFG